MSRPEGGYASFRDFVNDHRAARPGTRFGEDLQPGYVRPEKPRAERREIFKPFSFDDEPEDVDAG